MFKCAYCGSGMEDGDIFCGECGKRVGELSADVIRLLSALPSRDALHQLVSLYPGTLADEITFGVAAIQVFVSDKQRRAQYLSFYSLGLVEQLRGLKAMDQATFSRLVGILVDDGDLKPAAAEQCVGDWAYAFGLDLNSRQEVPLASHQAGEVLHLSLPKGVGLDMVWCPPGAFLMGSPEGELGRWDDEVQHRVTLTKGFWMAKYELTQEQYKALMGSNPANFKGPNRPVEQVSWDEAMAYCQKLNSKFSSSLPSGYKITLPTEAQWEYACRAGTTSALNSGRELTSEMGSCSNLAQVAWYCKNCGDKISDSWSFCVKCGHRTGFEAEGMSEDKTEYEGLDSERPCPRCSHFYIPDWNFCATCGLDFKANNKHCPSCSTPASEGWDYCAVCGHRINED